MALLLLFGFYSSLFAQDQALQLKILSGGADFILTGKVVKQNSNWNSDGTKIYTKVTIEVEEYLKGSNNKRIVVTHPGGEVGEVGELYSHMPSFKNNEEILLFVQNDVKTNTFKVFQGEKGKITLIKDVLTGEKMTSSKEKISSLKKEIKKYIEAQL
jgi:hypothetical protein